MQISAFCGLHRPFDSVTIVDAGMSLMRHEDLTPIVHDLDPHIVGLSGLSLEIAHLKGLARAVREARPDVPLIAGGPIATAFPKGLLGYVREIDAAAWGEGEWTMVDIARRVESGLDLRGVPGLALRRKNGQPYMTNKRGLIEDLDDLPPVDWSSIDIRAYNDVLNITNTPLDDAGCAVIMSTRGCPFACSYCHKFFGRKVREIAPLRVVDIMEQIIGDHGIRDFHFMDDIFNYRRGRIMELCGEIESRGLDVRYAFPNGLRGDLLTVEDVDAMASTGAYFVNLSIETVSPRLQRMIDKRLDFERTFENAALCSDRGILTRGFAMLGFPTETMEEMRATVDRMVESGFDEAMFFSVTPYPGTRLFDFAVKNGFSPERWGLMEFTYDHDVVNASSISDEDLRCLLKEAWRLFYNVPSRRRRLAAWVDSHGFGSHPFILESRFWNRVLGRDESWSQDRPTSEVMGSVEPAPTFTPALDGIVLAMELKKGWRVESMGLLPSGTHEIRLSSVDGAKVAVFVEPRDDSRGCLLRTNRFNIGVSSESPLTQLPAGLEDAIGSLAERLDGRDEVPGADCEGKTRTR